jgi:DNA modification methylase
MIRLNKIYTGDAKTILKTFPDDIVNCCVTSPPYYNLRDYGTANWIGGDSDCDHRYQKGGTNPETSSMQLGNKGTIYSQYETECKKCGAIRDDKQIGLEKTPEEYVQKLVDVFREVKRVLKKDGTLWLNIGDSYNGSGQDSGKYGKISQVISGKSRLIGEVSPTKVTKVKGLKPKDLIGIPWMVAFALRTDGWYLRNDIIWHKPNPMPESITDRCTKSHEYVFLLSKSRDYYFDHLAIQEKSIWFDKDNRANTGSTLGGKGLKGIYSCNSSGNFQKNGMRNKRDVWTVNTKPYTEAHFATFPINLILPMIKAGCPKDGVVLDPFIGSGTVAFVVRQYSRNFLGIDLKPDYVKLAEKRRNTLGLFR